MRLDSWPPEPVRGFDRYEEAQPSPFHPDGTHDGVGGRNIKRAFSCVSLIPPEGASRPLHPGGGALLVPCWDRLLEGFVGVGNGLPGHSLGPLCIREPLCTVRQHPRLRCLPSNKFLENCAYQLGGWNVGLCGDASKRLSNRRAHSEGIDRHGGRCCHAGI